MADLDVTDVLDDPDFYSPFVILRALVDISDCGIAQALSSGISAQGVVWQGGGNGLVRVGEGDYVEGDLAIISRFPLDTGTADTAADIVGYKDRFYVVTNGQAWDFGQGFTQAVCKLRTLNPSLVPPQANAGFLG